jgi:uncharacterized membrane protein
MNLAAAPLPAALQWCAMALVLLAGGWVWRTAPWRRLLDNTASHVFFGACVATLGLWRLHPEAMHGLDFHLLGASAFALLLGPQLALAGLSAVMAAQALAGAWPPAALPASMAVLPVALSMAVLRISERLLPRNPFVYLFVAAFLGPAVAMTASSGAAAGLLAAYAAADTAAMAEQFLPYCPLLGFAEATLTGMVITLLVVYRPAWVSTFSDDRYLGRSAALPRS